MTALNLPPWPEAVKKGQQPGTELPFPYISLGGITMVTNIGKLTTTSAAKSIPTRKPVSKNSPARGRASKGLSQSMAVPLTLKADPERSRQGATTLAASAKSKSDKQGANDLVTSEERHGMIATAAYFHAEQRGFTQGYELEDWMFGEAEIDSRLSLKNPLAEPRIHSDD